MRRGLYAAWLLLCFGSCHVARVKPAQPTCYDTAVVSCESCTDRGCAWCSEGPNPSDGYCCETGARCANPIKVATACVKPDNCEQATITSCGACLDRHCAWCPGEQRCRARGDDGRFPSCEGRVAGIQECPAAPNAGADP